METYQQIETWLREGRSHAWIARQVGLTRARIGQIAQELGIESMDVEVHVHPKGAVITGPYDPEIIAERVYQALKLAKVNVRMRAQ